MIREMFEATRAQARAAFLPFMTAGLPTPDDMLSVHVFASHRRSAIDEVWVGGELRVRAGVHALTDETRSALAAARRELLTAAA